MLYWVSCTESKKNLWGQDIGRDWETKTCREGREKEMVKVSEKALEQSFG